MKEISLDTSLYYAEHTSSDYPVGVYYIDMSKMFMHSVRLHWHSEMEIDYVRSGEALYCIGEEHIVVGAGCAIIINSGRIHSIRNNSDKDCVILSTLFDPGFLFDNDKSFVSHKYKKPVTDNKAFRYLVLTPDTRHGRQGIDSINQLLKTNLDKQYGYELMTKSLLCSLWLYLIEHAGKHTSDKPSFLSLADEERAKEAIIYINKNYSHELTLEEISDNIHISKSECCRSFKRATDMTPFEYIMSERIFESARKMQRSDEDASSISTLAESVGFNNASYFNKIFKKYLGVTPTKCKETIKKSHRDSLSPFGISISRL